MPQSDITPPAGRVFAVVPAAGESRRMGRPKLLLPIDERLVIHRVIDAIVQAGVTDIWVLVRDNHPDLKAELTGASANVITSAPTPGMRESTELLLREIQSRRQPTFHDAWLLCPADHPTLDSRVIRSLIEHRGRHPRGIWVPTWRGRRGHPVLFSWDLAREVPSIPVDRGLNHLLSEFAGDVHEVEVETGEVLRDLDTPDDYRAFLDRQVDPE